MENKNPRALPWAFSLVLHALGAILVLIAGFHFATPEGTVTDKVEFEAVGLETPKVERKFAPPLQEPAPHQGVAEPMEKTEPPTQEDLPQNDIPPQTMAEETQEKADVPQMESSDQSPAQPETPQDAENKNAPAETQPAAGPIPSETPAVLGSIHPENADQGKVDAVPQFGTPGSTLDESKLVEKPGNRKPDYPWTSRLRRQQGVVVIRAFVRKDGALQDAAIEKSSGYALLDQEALRAYKNWKYNPGPSGWVLKPFKFSLK